MSSEGMEILSRHNWHPFCTFIIGLPGETDDDTKRSLDLLNSLGAKALFVPTWFVPLEKLECKRRRRKTDRDDRPAMGVFLLLAVLTSII